MQQGVRVETRSGKFGQTVTTGKHQLIADEPVSFGGDDLGPGPYDYLLAALGACTSMTLQMYAARKGWALERVIVDLSHDRIHAKDCEDCGEGREGKVERIHRKITLLGSLDDEQKQRLLEIADKCPVHKTLTSVPIIKTTLG
jgi:putative redox protein